MAKLNHNGGVVLTKKDISKLQEGETVDITTARRPSEVVPPCDITGHDWCYRDVEREDGLVITRVCSTCNTRQKTVLDDEDSEWG